MSSDSMLTGLFKDLIESTNTRSHVSIDNAKLIITILLALITLLFVLADLLIFNPLLRKLRGEHKRTKEYEDQLAKLAHTDTLTGLGNRSFFNLCVAEMLNRTDQHGTEFAILLVDLDHFKSINDSNGHPAGDYILRHVAGALKTSFRSGDVVTRLGGDEFAVLLPGLGDASTLTALAGRAADAISRPVVFENRPLQLTASIGGAIAPTHGSDEAELIRVADHALYTAKKQRNSAVVFDEPSLALHLEQDKLTAGLAIAADRDEFIVHYQPKIDLRTQQHLGFEALVRWRHPELGLLMPGRFLPLMNDSRQFLDMTRAVVQIAARDLRIWKDAGLSPGSMAINLSETSLAGPSGYELLGEAIEENNLDWRDFVIEVTEDVFPEPAGRTDTRLGHQVPGSRGTHIP
ncbi:diguanylate cyclase [Roseibium salinum]|nr:diguanylate cyclase [Roseibium salinum]